VYESEDLLKVFHWRGKVREVFMAKKINQMKKYMGLLDSRTWKIRRSWNDN